MCVRAAGKDAWNMWSEGSQPLSSTKAGGQGERGDLHGGLAVGAEQRGHALVHLDAQQDALVLQLLHHQGAIRPLLVERLLVQNLQQQFICWNRN